MFISTIATIFYGEIKIFIMTIRENHNMLLQNCTVNILSVSPIETDTNVSQQKHYNFIRQCNSCKYVRTTTHVNGEPGHLTHEMSKPRDSFITKFA